MMEATLQHACQTMKACTNTKCCTRSVDPFSRTGASIVQLPVPDASQLLSAVVPYALLHVPVGASIKPDMLRNHHV